MDQRVTVLVADYRPLALPRLVASIEESPDFEVVGQASDGDGAVRRAASLRPKVALVAGELRTGDGLPAVLAMAAASVDTVVLRLVDGAAGAEEVSRQDADIGRAIRSYLAPSS